MRSYAAVVVAALLALVALLLPAHHVMADTQANGISMPPSPANDTDMAPSPSYVMPPPPVYPFVIVQGVIYCKTCRSTRYNRDMDASPLQGLHHPRTS
jgi:hypothetical protein